MLGLNMVTAVHSGRNSKGILSTEDGTAFSYASMSAFARSQSVVRAAVAQLVEVFPSIVVLRRASFTLRASSCFERIACNAKSSQCPLARLGVGGDAGPVRMVKRNRVFPVRMVVPSEWSNVIEYFLSTYQLSVHYDICAGSL